MARHFIAGVNDEVLTVPATDVRELITGLNPITDGRVFYLTELTLTNEHATQIGTVELYDQDEAAATAANQRAVIIVPANDTVIVKYEMGSMPFITNLTAGVTNGTFATLSQHASGYLA